MKYFGIMQLCLLMVIFSQVIIVKKSYGQTDLEPWGNIRGIRIDGQLMDFESSLRIVGKDWTVIRYSAKEKQQPHYSRSANKQLVTTRLDSFYFTEQVEDLEVGKAKVDIRFVSHADTLITGAFFSIELPSEAYSDSSVQLIEPATLNVNALAAGSPNEFLHAAAGGIRFVSSHRQLEILLEEPGLIIAAKEGSNQSRHIRIYLPLYIGQLHKEQAIQKSFSIRVSGDIDHIPVHLSINTSLSGRAFDGFGGNFRLQNPKTDSEVIVYCLKNMRVAWGRVEMPWRFWQPDKISDPMDSAEKGRLNPQVRKAMEMARTLSNKGIPLILSAWSAPNWAIQGRPKFRPGPDGVWGNPLEPLNSSEIYKSIADYIAFLKKGYGVDISLFSFNESDLGINIRMTGQEHEEFIKGLGSYLISRGIKTKLLLGDNSDATTYNFIYPAMEDAKAMSYVGAISFHSWRGWEKETLEKWATAASKLNLPLIVAEGSIDAAAWNYPAIFDESIYALEEINLYIRLLAICQPASILQWQLTADYSPLSGGGIFGNDGPVQPTRRFWNFKQLASTPEHLLAMPISCDRANITCAALGNNSKKEYAIHIVNNGATREVILTGLPKKVKELHIIRTDKQNSLKEDQPASVTDGEVHFTLEAASFTSVFVGKS
jgi:hypothetical protein